MPSERTLSALIDSSAPRGKVRGVHRCQPRSDSEDTRLFSPVSSLSAWPSIHCRSYPCCALATVSVKRSSPPLPLPFDSLTRLSQLYSTGERGGKRRYTETKIRTSEHTDSSFLVRPCRFASRTGSAITECRFPPQRRYNRESLLHAKRLCVVTINISDGYYNFNCIIG